MILLDELHKGFIFVKFDLFSLLFIIENGIISFEINLFVILFLFIFVLSSDLFPLQFRILLFEFFFLILILFGKTEGFETIKW